MNTYSKFLNYIATLLILFIISIFIVWFIITISNQRIERVKEIKINLSVVDTNINEKFKYNSIETNKQLIEINDSLTAHVKTLNDLAKKIDEYELKNNDTFNYIISLIGFIFAIVGFFGFKSINDARETAIKNAVNEAQNIASIKAKEIAELEAQKISQETAEKVATYVSETISKAKAEMETKKYLAENFPELFRITESTYVNSYDEKLSEINDKLNKLEHPESYGIENQQLKELLELKLKFGEILDIINELKKNKIVHQNG